MDLRAHRNEDTGRWTLEGVEPSEKTFERMCQMLRDGVNFKFARYGDGEFACMFGKAGHNCDGHEYFPDLGHALNEAFYSDPKYMIGIQPLSVQGGLYQKAILQREGYPKNIYDADVLHSASIDGRLPEFIEAMRLRHVICVGPQHLENYLDSLRIKLISIPDKNCWKEHNEISEFLYLVLQGDSDYVVLFCASMMSEVLINRLQEMDHTFIDCGSVFDVYAGVKSRRYHHKLQWISNTL